MKGKGAGIERRKEIKERKEKKERKKRKRKRESGLVNGGKGERKKKDKGEERESEWDTCPIVGTWEEIMLSLS